jgi:Leucine-rich repeat (LRR) protein
LSFDKFLSNKGINPVYRELIACYNKLEYIPPSLGRLKRLRRLVLNSNRLKTVPAELGNLDVLEELFLSENSLEEFPNSIAKIPNLRVIKLANNKLKDLPYELADLLSLEDIDCANNPHLQTVPESWRNDSQSILFICRIHRGLLNYRLRFPLSKSVC